ncbi:hypothetical protein ACIRL0_16860 [Streptomyces sp. NPDC102365]|uniref:hypothetical protein n=1 Tax=Streptomyces sp. NPDC102365 TaxID=3366162 RepID=UPI003804D4D6
MVPLAAVLARVLPDIPARASAGYAALLVSVLTTVRRHRSVQITMVLSSLATMVFTLFWTALTFLLSAPPYEYPVTRIGLVGLVGLVGPAGALAVRRAGLLHDGGWSVRGIGAGLLLALVAVVVSGIGAHSVVAVLIAVLVLVLDIGIQTVNVLNQTRLMSVEPQSRSPLNTAFVSGNFIGGTIGSALATVLWQGGGWTLVMTGAGALLAAALIISLLPRRRSETAPVMGQLKRERSMDSARAA